MAAFKRKAVWISWPFIAMCLGLFLHAASYNIWLRMWEILHIGVMKLHMFCLCNSGKSVWTWTGRISICSSHFGSCLWLLVFMQVRWCWLQEYSLQCSRKCSPFSSAPVQPDSWLKSECFGVVSQWSTGHVSLYVQRPTPWSPRRMLVIWSKLLPLTTKYNALLWTLPLHTQGWLCFFSFWTWYPAKLGADCLNTIHSNKF